MLASKRLIYRVREARSVRAKSVATSQQQLTDGLIFKTGMKGSWDEAGVGSPVVRCYFGDNEERWVMWYSGRANSGPALDMIAPSSGSTGVAISGNGLDWIRGSDRITGDKGEGASSDVGMVMEPNKDWWCFDTCHLQVSDVQIFSNAGVNSGVGVFWMFYSGGDFQPLPVPSNFPVGAGAGAGAVEGLRMRPGLAMSQDGRNWARIEADHHTGALFDVGQTGEWDEMFIGTPKVIAAGPKDMRLFYHSFDVGQGRFVVGVATSPDGFKWTKQGMVFDPVAEGATGGSHDALGAATLQVIRDVDNRQYVMFYEAVASDNSRSIGMAVSKDGMTGWQRYPHPVLEAGAMGSWDSGHIGQPCAVSMSKGRWRLYYSGRQTGSSGSFEGFGCAVSVEGGEKFQGMPTAYKRRDPQPVS